MTPVRVGVVGLGYWGPQLVRNLYESPYADLVTGLTDELWPQNVRSGAYQRMLNLLTTTTTTP